MITIFKHINTREEQKCLIWAKQICRQQKENK